MDDVSPPSNEPKPPAETPQEEPVLPESPVLEDPKTDNLVDEIQHGNSDAELEAAFVPETPALKRSLKQKYLDNKKWTIPATVVAVLLIAVFAVPLTRYKVVGLVLKKTYTVAITDASTGTAVSKAEVTLAGKTTLSDANGKAVFKKVAVGSAQARVSKQYYKTTTMKAFVGISGKNTQKLLLQATGRQVTIKLVNKITGLPINDAEITALGTSAKTDKTGSAVIVLPADHKTATATITATGYNGFSSAVQITTDVVPANSLSLVPSGRAYFLSNASGKLDVISANYDGSDRKTLLAGTGYETNAPTQLIQSPDQKYLALITLRTNNTSNVGLYSIDTTSGKMTKIESDAHQNISAVGWSGGNFVYTTQNYDAQDWQPGQQALRSYNGASNQVATLDQSDAQGTNDGDHAGQIFSQANIVDSTVVYAKSWTAGFNAQASLQGKSNSIFSVLPNGTGKKDLHDLSIPANAYYTYVGANLAGPHTVYFASPTTSTNDYSQGALFFKFTKGSLTQLNNFTANDYNNPNLQGYLETSPSGNNLLYSDTVDGQTVASVAGQSGTKQKLVTLRGAASVKSWLTDDYILVSQDNSQLYVISSNPAATQAQPLQLSSFYTPPAGGR